MKRRILKTAAEASPFAAGFLAAVPVYASDARPLAEKLSEAGRNTVLGIVTVLLILFGLSLIISLFRFIPGAGGKKEKPKTSKPDAGNFVITSKNPAAARPDDDGEELAAVIMAAIAAYEGEGYDPTKYRLRSIKRTGSSRRWNRAGRQL